MAAGLLTLVLAVGGLCASPSAPAGGACRAALPNGRQAPAHIAASPAPRRAAPLCTASAARARTDDASAGDADERQPLGFSFSVGGLLFAYQLGVGRALVDEGFIVPGVTPLSGASSGSLVAAVLALDLPLELVLDRLRAILADCRQNGTSGRLGALLRQQMLSALPEDAHARLRAGALSVPYVRVLPIPTAFTVSSFTSRDDLFDVLHASCNWPFFLARSPLVVCRGGLALDGYFVAPRTLGCVHPLPNARRTVAVSAFPGFAVPSLAAALAEPARDLIEPAIDGRFPRAEADPDALRRWLSSALSAYDEARLQELLALGEAHGRLWAARERDPDTAAGI